MPPLLADDELEAPVTMSGEGALELLATAAVTPGGLRGACFAVALEASEKPSTVARALANALPLGSRTRAKALVLAAAFAALASPV